ncbi:hypothetical protein CDL12_16371 [Handroanthus impetiginosus]|uniref:Uncharacterized protein n=1 Tax=Handroanthus impetiginosus TaxID=429701 RepID=A0A2G9H0J8_9LAMI|nr:hypothetical protein CDL12_16371 [Handroanthus impetiginosus]
MDLQFKLKQGLATPKSKKFHGRCFFINQRSNCKTIYKREKLITGHCFHGTCFCLTKCGTARHTPLHPPPSEGGEGGGDFASGNGAEGGRLHLFNIKSK